MSNLNPVDQYPMRPNTRHPAVADLRPPDVHERRNLAARAALTDRIRAEFIEVPRLSLTLPQGMKLFALGEGVTLRIFSELVRAEMLWLTTDGRYTPRTSVS